MEWIDLLIFGKPVKIAFDENSIHVYNAFPVKDELKVRGYRWNPGDKSWYLNPGDVAEELASLKSEASPSLPAATANEPLPAPANDGLPPSFSVKELRDRIDSIVRQGLPGTIWVRGVVASQPKDYQWATYFDLRDEDRKLTMVFSAELRQGARERLNRKLKSTGTADKLEKDLPVFLQVEAGLSAKYTVNVRLQVIDILPEFTQAKIRNQREITVDRLRQEGILDIQKKLQLPRVASRIGIISSELGTSVADILAGLSPMQKHYSFLFVDARMEGAGAVNGMIRAIDRLELQYGDSLDALVIARGGGSEQSLSVFNDYRLCRRICVAAIPVLTAVGHEKDLSAAEICSHYTPVPSTPSGMGRFLGERIILVRSELDQTVHTLISRYTGIQQRESEKMRSMLRILPAQGAQKMKQYGLLLRSGVRELQQGVRVAVRDQERKLIFNARRTQKMMFLLSERQHRVLTGAFRHLINTVERSFSREKKSLQKSVRQIDLTFITRKYSEKNREIKQYAAGFLDTARRQFALSVRDLKKISRNVSAFDPDRILKRGFAMIIGRDRRIVPNRKKFLKLKEATLRFHDGDVNVYTEEEE